MIKGAAALKTDHQREMEAVIASFSGGRPRLLLHACCAPCSSAVLERVEPFFETAIFYYNPNISPAAEYDKRAAEFSKLMAAPGRAADTTFIAAEYRHGEFLDAARGLEDQPEGGERCGSCFLLRLERTAAKAKAEGYDYFATTLTVSPHKNADAINAIGGALAEKYGVLWLPSDFKKRNGYLRSIELCREYGIYRQSWCGCEFAG